MDMPAEEEGGPGAQGQASQELNTAETNAVQKSTYCFTTILSWDCDKGGDMHITDQNAYQDPRDWQGETLDFLRRMKKRKKDGGSPVGGEPELDQSWQHARQSQQKGGNRRHTRQHSMLYRRVNISVHFKYKLTK